MGNCSMLKSFNVFSAIALTLFSFLGVAAIILSSHFLLSESMFHCHHENITKKNDVSRINTDCFNDYQDEFHFSLPIIMMFGLNFGIIAVLNIVCALLLRSRVKPFVFDDTTKKNADQEGMISRSREDHRKDFKRFSTLFIYILHLFVSRIIPSLVFAILVFSPARIPDEYLCSWQPDMQGNNISPFNGTLKCKNLLAAKSTTLINTIVWSDIIFATLAFLECLIIVVLIFNDKNFLTDQEFCTVYVLRIRKGIRRMVHEIREECISIHSNVFRSNDDFGGHNGEIYVNVVIQEEKEELNAYPEEFERNKIYRSYLETPSTVTKLGTIADLFKPKKGEQNQTCTRTILVLGRPGIGKTMLTKKLLHQWKVQEDHFWHDKIVILLQFRAFKADKPVTFRDMLSFGHGITSVETVYNFVVSNPSKTVLIFDGLDELDADSNASSTNIATVPNLNEKVPVFSFFKSLVAGTFMLQGITVLTTSRPTARHFLQNLTFHKTCEILGFFNEQIEEYVNSFCGNNIDTSEFILNQIEASLELQSLCYLPFNCYIICLTLKERIENSESFNSPISFTGLCAITLKALLNRHHPNLKFKDPPCELNASFSPEIEKDLSKLKEVAKNGITKKSLIFERATEGEFGDLANCGLFQKFPTRWRNKFCFLHLTLQEFLAASKVVDDMERVENFLTTNVVNPEWRMVIQFVAGLVCDRNRDTKYQETIVEERYTSLFKEWAFSLGNGNEENKTALLGIKCLYEFQDLGIMKSVYDEFLPGRDGELCLTDLDIAPDDATALFEFLGNCKNLIRLQFCNCKILDEYSYRIMGKLLFDNRANAITSFSWIGNGLTDQFVKCISDALMRKHCKLTELDLKDNQITDQALAHLCDALKHRKCEITKLVLTSNNVGDNGAGYLSNVLRCPRSKLTTLHLVNTEIGDDGVESLCNAGLRSVNCKLNQLILCNSSITHVGAKYLHTALEDVNCKLILV